MIVNNGTIDLSPLPYDVMMEITQSEDIRAPEVQLYHFLRMWAKNTEIKLSHEEVQSLFGHVRYATIPHQELKQIGKYSFNNNPKFWAALNGDLKPLANQRRAKPDVKQFTNRKCQEVLWLLNTSEEKKWARKIENASSPIYAIVSDEQERAIVMTWSVEKKAIVPPTGYVSFDICSLSAAKRTSLRERVKIPWLGKVSPHTLFSEHQITTESYRASVAGLTMRLASTRIKVELFHSFTKNIEFAEPYPWLIMIQVEELEKIIIQTL